MLSLFSPRPEPTTPRTPADLLAALALSPTVTVNANANWGRETGTGLSSAVPCLSFIPPTPSTRTSLTSIVLNSPATTSSGFNSESGDVDGNGIEKKITFRRLTPLEARQLTLLLTQHLFPVRNSHKSLMRESIVLAEKLHEAGIRWDRYRRVMGVHLRGIWTEGAEEHFGLLVQGSFLSIADQPHPLDPTPLPIPLDPATYTALPRFTLNSHTMSNVTHKDFALIDQTNSFNSETQASSDDHRHGHGHEFELHEGLSNELAQNKAKNKNKKSQVGQIDNKDQNKFLKLRRERGRWNERKKSVELRIHTDSSHKIPKQALPVSASSARSLTLSLSLSHHQNSRSLSILRIDKLRRAFRRSRFYRNRDKSDLHLRTPGIVGLIPTLMPNLGLPLRAGASKVKVANEKDERVDGSDQGNQEEHRALGEMKSTRRVSFAVESMG